jgi:hypothetical protein
VYGYAVVAAMRVLHVLFVAGGQGSTPARRGSGNSSSSNDHHCSFVKQDPAVEHLTQGEHRCWVDVGA